MMLNSSVKLADSLRDSRRGVASRSGRDPKASDDVTRVLHRIVTQLVRRERADTDHAVVFSPEPEPPCSPEELATALPGWKRILDLLIVGLTLPLWLPVMVLMTIWVAVTSPGPVFYRQPRIGFKGRRFMIVKLRTMKVNAETHVHESYLEELMVTDRPMIKLDATGDPRLIVGGKFLRATALDELPQIFNILRGEMSIVGPRPCTVQEFECLAPEYRARTNAFPGMTGFWQVNGKNNTTFRQMIDMDIFYARNISFWLDVRIILRTAPALLTQVFELWQTSPSTDIRSAPPANT